MCYTRWRLCRIRAHRYILLPLLLPTVAVVSGIRMFRATRLPYPPPIPLRLLHSFSSRPLHLLPLLVLHHSSSSSFATSVFVVLHLALSLSRSVKLVRAPDQLFFLPVTVQISIPETPRDRWGCGPFICARQCLSYENRETRKEYGYWALLYLNYQLRNFFINRCCVDYESILIYRQQLAKTFFKT